MEIRNEEVEYNLLTGKLGRELVEVDPIDLWTVFLTSLNARIGVTWINPKEIAVLSWIMAQPFKRCYFTTPHKEEIMSAIENLSPPELSRIKKKLLKLKLVEEKLEGSRVRTYPVSTLLALKAAIQNRGSISFSFGMKLKQ